MRGPGKFLDKESPIQGPWCRFRREARPASDIDTVVVDSLKALDPEWPIREADIARPPTSDGYYTNAPKGARSIISMRVPQGS